MGQSLKGAHRLHSGDEGLRWLDLGIRYSSGTDDTRIDLVEAHKWFNLAAMSGLDTAQEWRSEIATDMTARQIAQAQKAARAFVAMGARVN
ncbi:MULTISPECIES: hypothetical protein [unclassified Sphingomonas]|uniref:hypothetical protein n=1 Tax=unclassified Sphingomonas TaxID=196159 RepID=UPI000AFE5794|nr:MULTISPECIES: hypothetical protein [unclassified Sphingomonas]